MFLEKKCSLLQKDNEKYKISIGELEKYITQIQNDVSLYKNQSEQNSTRLKSQKQQIIFLEKDNDCLNHKYKLSQHEKTKAEELSLQLKHDLENQRKSYEDKLKTLEDNYTKVKEDLNYTQNQYNRIKEDYEDILNKAEEFQRLHDTNRRVSVKVPPRSSITYDVQEVLNKQTLQDKVDKMQQQLNQTREKQKETNEKNNKLEEKLKYLKEKIDIQNDQIIEKTMQHRKSRSSLMLEGLIKKNNEKINNHKLNQQTMTIEQLEQKLDQQQELIETQSHQIQKFKKIISSLKEELKPVKAQPHLF